MPRRYPPLLAGNYYHIYNRGLNRGAVFYQPENYTFFLDRLRKYVASKQANIIAYALLPNHYHLLVETPTDDLSHAMQLLSIS
jgi:REP element-mobilizing transposase RayT